MKVVVVAALLALLALCEGLGVVKEGPLKKHDRKKDSLVSSAHLKEDKKEASVLRLTGQPLVPKRDIPMDVKTDVIDAKTSVLKAKDDLMDTTRSAVSKDDEVSFRVRQQLQHSEGVRGETAAKQSTEGELVLAKGASDDPESKAVSIGTVTVSVGPPALPVGGIGGLLAGLPSIAINGVPLGGLLPGIGAGGVIGPIIAGLIGIKAALVAGLAKILKLIVPGLQIANQVLAIIAISLLGAYVFGDKGGEEYYDTGYASGTGYEDSGTGYGASPGVVGSGTGYSSYSDYRRSALAQAPFDGYTNLFGQQQGLAANSIDGSGLDDLFAGSPILAVAGKPVVTGRSGRSMVSDELVKRVGSLVSDAVEKYSKIYEDGKETQEGKE